jgi:ABC-type lipoprotein release transport system permease subunit
MIFVIPNVYRARLWCGFAVALLDANLGLILGVLLLWLLAQLGFDFDGDLIWV